jgi:hypothetical protein
MQHHFEKNVALTLFRKEKSHQHFAYLICISVIYHFDGVCIILSLGTMLIMHYTLLLFI